MQVECNKIQRTLIFQTRSQTTTISEFGQVYIFHYQFKLGKHEIKLENTRLISFSTSKLISFG